MKILENICLTILALAFFTLWFKGCEFDHIETMKKLDLKCEAVSNAKDQAHAK